MACRAGDIGTDLMVRIWRIAVGRQLQLSRPIVSRGRLSFASWWRQPACSLVKTGGRLQSTKLCKSSEEEKRGWRTKSPQFFKNSWICQTLLGQELSMPNNANFRFTTRRGSCAVPREQNSQAPELCGIRERRARLNGSRNFLRPPSLPDG